MEFFGVATVEAWRQRYENPLAAFRASESFDKKQGAVAAWLRKGEVEADLLECEAFNRQSFRATLSEVRRVTNEPEPNIFIPKLQELCAGSGVAVVFAPTPPGCPVSGATRWLTSSKAVLQLSLRYSSNDHLWFTFFHEAAHLLLHGKRLLNLEGIDPRDDSEEIREREANDFARDFLIPPEDAFRLGELASRPKVSKIMVRRFAAGIGLAPGIVVGRMQHEGWLEYSHMNDLKVRYRWPD
ncbi:MAG: ImmA/IrrE family metallo-endopeptidase [Acidobacteriota bacterium]